MNSSSDYNHAPTPKRFIAWLVDLIIVAILVCALRFSFATLLANSGISGSKIYTASMVLGIVIATLYHAIFESSKFQATPGKLVFGLRITNISGQKLSFARALARHLAKYLSELTLGIGYATCIFSRKKQCLHDVIAKCIVTNK